MTDQTTPEALTDDQLRAYRECLSDAMHRHGELYLTTDAPHDMLRLLDEVDRLRAQLAEARERYETEAREQHLTALREAGRRLGESFQQLGEAIRDGAAKARAEHEEREQLRALVDRHGMADRTCLIGDDTTE